MAEYNLDKYSQTILRERLEKHATIYAVEFLPRTVASPPYLVAAYSTGVLRVFSVPEITQKWLGHQAIARHLIEIQAHQGAVFCLASFGSGDAAVLLSGGEDAWIRGWSFQHLRQAAAASARNQTYDETQACLALQLPRVVTPFGPIPQQANVLTMTVDESRQRLYAGTADGGCHEVPLAQLPTERDVTSLTGHIAAVQSMDCCSSISSVASSSEDSTVRLWDFRAGKCNRVLDMFDGAEVANSQPALLKCLDHPPTTCVRFDPSGCWLIASCGDECLSGMNLMSGTLEQPRISSTVQHMAIQPGEILVVGTEPFLTRYNFSFQQTSRSPISCRSAFWIDIDPVEKLMAVSGSNGTLDLLSQYGTKVGKVSATSVEDEAFSLDT